jgi:hypothetical protein
MNRLHLTSLILFAWLIGGCSPAVIQPTTIQIPTQIPTQILTSTVKPAPTNTATPTSTATSVPSTTPSSVPTDTPTVTPTQEQITTATPTSAMDALVAANPMLSAMANVKDVTQYYHPVGTPEKVWKAVAIMPQATAGQDYGSGIYSYKADATLDQAIKFYQTAGNIPGTTTFPMSTGYGGSGSNATHDAIFLYPEVFVDIVSFDNDPSHVIIVISKP